MIQSQKKTMKQLGTGDGPSNIKDEVVAICKTTLLLNGRFGASYIIGLLRGDAKFGVKSPSHRDFETYGVFPEANFGRLKGIISLLLKKGFLDITNEAYGTIGVTDMALAYVDQPKDWEVHPRKLSLKQFDLRLKRSLSELRNNIAAQANCRPYEVFTNHVIDQIITTRPTDVTELKGVQGMKDSCVDDWGHLVLKKIAENEEDKAVHRKKRLEQKALSPSLQHVKKLFLEGKTVNDIAEIRQIKPSTVREYFKLLHATKQLDLTSWIEKQVDSYTLFLGADYFQKNPDVRLKQAYEELGLDYETLKLCRMYVSRLEKRELSLA